MQLLAENEGIIFGNSQEREEGCSREDERGPYIEEEKESYHQKHHENEAKALFYSRVEQIQSIKGNVQAA